MKKQTLKLTALTLLFPTLLLSLAFVVEKNYSVSYSVNNWDSKLRNIEMAKQALLQSDLPTKTVIPIIDSLSVFQQDIRTQVTQQLKDTTKTK